MCSTAAALEQQDSPEMVGGTPVFGYLSAIASTKLKGERAAAEADTHPEDVVDEKP